MWLLKKAVDELAFRSFVKALNTDWLSDEEFVVFVRQNGVTKLARDETLIALRKNPGNWPATICKLRALFHWKDRPPKTADELYRFGAELEAVFRTMAIVSKNDKFLYSIFHIESLAVVHAALAA